MLDRLKYVWSGILFILILLIVSIGLYIIVLPGILIWLFTGKNILNYYRDKSFDLLDKFD